MSISLLEKCWYDKLIKMIDHKALTRNAFKIIFQGTGSWNDAKNKSIYPVNKYGLIISKIWRGIKDIAEPIKTVLIVIIIGVTLFLKKVDNIKHKLLIVIITIVEIINAIEENIKRAS